MEDHWNREESRQLSKYLEFDPERDLDSIQLDWLEYMDDLIYQIMDDLYIIYKYRGVE